MIADADRLMRWFIGELARDAGWTVTEAETIQIASAFLQSPGSTLELIILDCPRTLADLPNISLLRQLKPGCCIVATVAFPTDAFIARARAAGVDRVLTKPIDADEIKLLLTGQQTMSPASEAAPYRVEPPTVLQRVRRRLLQQLAQASSEPGELGELAREAQEILSLHASHEDRHALPTLGALALLANGVVWREMNSLAAMAASLNQELPVMLEDHEAILAVLRRFEQVARGSGRSELVLLAQRLMDDVEIETEVLYPAAIVAGKFLESQMNPTRYRI
jgi:DNA-binding response OmpR family regulator